MPVQNDRPDWARLLADAVNHPGVISEAYRRFWEYSVGNQVLAMIQCQLRGIEPGPIHTFKGWLDVGRHVKPGQKALTLCMPVKVKRKPEESRDSPGNAAGAEEAGESVLGTRTIFVYKRHWFVLSQTEGADYVPTEMPEWSEARALETLAVRRIPFDHPNGNCQGYALKQNVAVSPIAVLPHKTLFHEFAHVLLGHTEETGALDDHDLTPVNLREVEAECTALICCESLGLPGTPECRGYIQSWLGKGSIRDRSAQRIFKAADQILKAGCTHSSQPGDPASCL